jgi:cytochrome P450
MPELSETELSLVSLLQGEALLDPGLFYRRLHAHDPIHWDGPANSWVLVRYADLMTIIQSPHVSSGRIRPALNRMPPETREALRPVFERLAKQVMFLDPPDHTRLRGLLNKAFTARVVELMRAQVQQIVDELLDRVQPAGQMDLIRDFAYPLPATVIGDLLGVPRADQDQFKKWTSDFALFLGSTREAPERAAEALQGVAAFIEYFRGLVADHRAHPREDLLTALSAPDSPGAIVDEDELFANCMFLLAAGHETTMNLIGNGMWTLFQNPDQLAQLQADPALIKPAVEEILRYESPIRAMGRLVAEDFDLDGRHLQAGQTITLVMGAANRDPARFPDPDRFDIHRADNRHIAFGHGPHFCIGAPLARLEGQLALGTLLRRLPALRLATTTPDWDPNILFRGLKSLPVTF